MLDIKLVRKRQTNYPAVFDAINRNFLRKAGIMVSDEARDRAPNRDGFLIGSIKYKVKKDSVIVGTNMKYAVYVEYGTGKHAEGGRGRKKPWVYFSDKYGFIWTEGMEAQPFLRKALDVNRKNLVKLWADTYKKVFKVLGGKYG